MNGSDGVRIDLAPEVGSQKVLFAGRLAECPFSSRIEGTWTYRRKLRTTGGRFTAERRSSSGLQRASLRAPLVTSNAGPVRPRTRVGRSVTSTGQERPHWQMEAPDAVFSCRRGRIRFGSRPSAPEHSGCVQPTAAHDRRTWQRQCLGGPFDLAPSQQLGAPCNLGD